ncbi:hypothetical protein CsSME_00004468 [Camellia sinensis var. sinensis]
MPCLDVGNPKRPNYLLLEFCALVSLQHYTKALSSIRRASLVEKSRKKPQELIRVVTDTRNVTGLVAPAPAAGLGALTHTLGTLIPMTGAGGFATTAAVIAIGTAVGSFR